MSDLTIEAFADELAAMRNELQTFTANHTDLDKEMPKDKDMAMAKKKRIAAIKKAMDDDTLDDDKKEAAVRKAMEEEDKDMKKEANGEKEEEKEHIASIVESHKQQYITQILTANAHASPQYLKQLELSLRTASIAKVKEHWSHIAPFIDTAVAMPTRPIITPYSASISSTDIDEQVYDASTPDSVFAKMTSEEIMEMYR